MRSPWAGTTHRSMGRRWDRGSVNVSWFSLIVVIQIIFQWSVSGVFLIRSLPLVTEIVLAIPTGGKGHRIAAHGIYGQFLDIKATSTFTSNLVQ